MSQFDIDSGSSSSNQDEFIKTQPNKYTVSILKHLPEARKIMQGHNYQHQITKCVYQQPLVNNPAFIIPKLTNTQNSQLSNNRLVKLDQILFEHENMKQKIKNMLQRQDKGNNQSNGTLWTNYSSINPCYTRFGAHARKNNFANVIMPINGVNISLGSKFSDKPVQNQIRIFPMSPGTVRFDSHFQSGNLLYAYRKQSLQIQTYDLILQNDINTKGHNQWFYFKVYNSKKHNKIRFNIVNFIKSESMFSYGIKPLTFSQRDFSRHRIGWVRDGQRVVYHQNKMKRQCNDNNYYTLTFQYYFREIDTVYFAPTHPYTHTQLNEYFDNIMAEHSLSNFIQMKCVAQTVGRNSVNVITFGTGVKQIQECSVAWILGRQHPGETTSSYIIEGMINYLVSLYSSPSSQHAQALDNLIFKIVPMVNVDGVVHGNTRAELTGVDPNRMWKRTMKRLCPEVSAIKKLIAQNKQSVKLVLDLHSHSKKLGCFFYGNSSLYDPKSTKIYPTIVCEKDQRFQLKHCRFRGGYQTTARSVLYYDLGIRQVYTVECSLLGYLKKGRITDYKISDYYEMGRKLIDSYIQLQKKKKVKAEVQIIHQLADRMIDKEDAESARSESSLSDEQYEQIKLKVKNKVKKRKVKKQNQNTTIPLPQSKQSDGNKYYYRKNLRANTKIQASLNDKRKKCQQRQMSTNELRPKNNILNLKNNQNKTIKDVSAKKGISIGLKQPMPVSKINPNRRLAQRDVNQQRKNSINASQSKIQRQYTNIRQDNSPKIIQKKQAEVQVYFFQDKHVQNKKSINKSRDHALCVVGSSLEDDIVCVCKNQVGVQNSQQMIEQAMLNGEGFKKSMKIKKIPKILNYLCSNLIGVQQQNSVLPQDRRLAPLALKKYGNITKI